MKKPSEFLILWNVLFPKKIVFVRHILYLTKFLTVVIQMHLRRYLMFIIDSMDQYQDLCDILDCRIEEICDGSQSTLTQFAVKEALNNAVEHGSFPIFIEFANLPTGEHVIKIKDSGKGFLVVDTLNVIRKKGVDRLLADKRFDLRGRGLLIMLKTVSKVDFNETGNEVQLTINS